MNNGAANEIVPNLRQRRAIERSTAAHFGIVEAQPVTATSRDRDVGRGVSTVPNGAASAVSVTATEAVALKVPVAVL